MNRIWYATESSFQTYDRLARGTFDHGLAVEFNLEDMFSWCTQLRMKMLTVTRRSHQSGDAMPCRRLRFTGTSRPGTRVSTFWLRGFRCFSWSTRGFLGFTASSQHTKEQKHNYLKWMVGEITSHAARKRTGKVISYKHFRYYTLNFKCLALSIMILLTVADRPFLL